jgi:predicted nucleic acid-binding protein
MSDVVVVDASVAVKWVLDAHYLALAEQQNCEYWTADTRLWNTVRGKLSWIRWLGDYHS